MGMSLTDCAYARSFCLLNFSSTVKIFSSVKRMDLTSSGPYRRRSARHRRSLFFFCCIVSIWQVPRFKAFNLRSFLSALCIVCLETFICNANFFWHRRGLRLMRFFSAFSIRGVLLSLGRPLLGRSSTVPVSLYRFTVRYTKHLVTLPDFSTLQISEFVFPCKWSCKIALRFL